MKIKKLIATFTAFAVMTGALPAFAEGVAVFVNGEALSSEALETENGVYVSLEEVAEKIGAQIEWSGNGANIDTNADKAVVEMIASVSESVVAIVGNYKDSSLSSDAQDYNELYAHGAGAVISSEGVIITNAHVVDEIQNLTVVFGNGETYPGTVLYSDETSDLAVVKINRRNLKSISFAEEGSLKVGETVVAIGTPLSVNLINSATKGIVSGVGVNISQHYLFTQSDVAINGGNSGGPLVNLKGELVGINSIKYVGSEIEGMSFSIPVDTINYVLDSFKNYGRVIRPDTGVTMTESWESKIGVPTTKGLTVTSSENEQLNAGDMITHVNGYEVHSIADYNEALKKSFDGNAVEFTYIRGGVVATAVIETETDLSRDTDGRVEISFVVGSSSLMINGFINEVETPYIAGDGTTLVPLRVITEAFGAKVEWIDETQSIMLEYPDIAVELQIGNSTAVVNGEETMLPVPPELAGDVTMVPLRFLSETFGALVDYDGETGRITVIKEAEEETGTIKFSTDLPRVGDSYWNWSMLTPTSMMMSDRSLDGMSTQFYDEGGYVEITIYDYSDDEDYTTEEIFDEAYEDAMYYTFEDLTLSKDEKGTDEFGNSFFRLTGRSKYSQYDCYSVVRDKVLFEINVYCDTETAQTKTYTSILESFRTVFAANEDEEAQTYDLSNVDDDGYRPMKDEELKISCRVPADFTEGYTGYYSINTLEYTNNGGDSLALTVYSVSDSVNSESIINSEADFDAKYLNGELCTVSEVSTLEGSFGENIFCYTVTTDGIGGEDAAEEAEDIAEEPTEVETGEAVEEIAEKAKDTDEDYKKYVITFEKGDYVYEIKIREERADGELFEKIVESFEAKELDGKKMGVFMRQDKSFTEKKFSKGDWSFTINSSWSESYAGEEYGYYTNSYTKARLSFNVMAADEVDYTSAKSAAEDALKNVKTMYDEDEYEILKSVTQITLGSNSYYTFAVKTTTENYYGDTVTSYATAYIMKKGGKFYAFELREQEEYANAQTKTDVESALGTFTVETK